MKKFPLLILSLLALFLAACAEHNDMIDVSVSGLTGYQVVDSNGEPIAEVEDVLLTAESGQISYAILDLQRGPFRYGKAAFVDASVPRTAVPWDCFTLDSASEQLQLQVDRATLVAAPLLTEKPNHLEADWDADVRAYWEAYLMASTQEQTTENSR